MKVRLIVNPALEPSMSLADYETDMLLLGRFQDGGAGPVQAFDERTNGKLSEFLRSRKFTGKVGNRFTYHCEHGQKQDYLMVMGLGASASFSCQTIAKVLGIAIHKAVKHQCGKLSILFFPHRFDSGLHLTSQAQVTHEAALVKIAEYDAEKIASIPGRTRESAIAQADSELLIELVCMKTGPAQRQLQAGLDLPITGRVCCRHVDGHKED